MSSQQLLDTVTKIRQQNQDVTYRVMEFLIRLIHLSFNSQILEKEKRLQVIERSISVKIDEAKVDDLQLKDLQRELRSARLEEDSCRSQTLSYVSSNVASEPQKSSSASLISDSKTPTEGKHEGKNVFRQQDRKSADDSDHITRAWETTGVPHPPQRARELKKIVRPKSSAESLRQTRTTKSPVKSASPKGRKDIARGQRENSQSFPPQSTTVSVLKLDFPGHSVPRPGSVNLPALSSHRGATSDFSKGGIESIQKSRAVISSVKQGPPISPPTQSSILAIPDERAVVTFANGIDRSPDGDRILSTEGMPNNGVAVCDSNAVLEYRVLYPSNCRLFDVVWLDEKSFVVSLESGKLVKHQAGEWSDVGLPTKSEARGLARDDQFLYICDRAQPSILRYGLRELNFQDRISLHDSRLPKQTSITPYMVGVDKEKIIVTDKSNNCLHIIQRDDPLLRPKKHPVASLLKHVRNPGENLSRIARNYSPTGVFCHDGGNAAIVLVDTANHASGVNNKLLVLGQDLQPLDLRVVEARYPEGVVIRSDGRNVVCDANPNAPLELV